MIVLNDGSFNGNALKPENFERDISGGSGEVAAVLATAVSQATHFGLRR